jgi:hypothetical protein
VERGEEEEVSASGSIKDHKESDKEETEEFLSDSVFFHSKDLIVFVSKDCRI